MNAFEVLSQPMPECLLGAGVQALLAESFSRLRQDLARYAPLSAVEMQAWVARQNAPDAPELSFRGLKSHFLLIPHFLETRICGSTDSDFQRELIYSSLNGYYFARMLDNVADRESPEDGPLLPMAGFFHYNFHAAYTQWFEPASPFWKRFREFWIGMADMTAWASRRSSFSESDLGMATSGRIAAVKIPIAAVGFRYGREDLLESWFDFYDYFCCAHELLDDLFDCFSDLSAGRSSFLLSQASREKHCGETVESFLIRAGLERGYAAISMRLAEAASRAEFLESKCLIKFVQTWRDRVQVSWDAWLPHLKQLAKLAEALEPSSPTSAAER